MYFKTAGHFMPLEPAGKLLLHDVHGQLCLVETVLLKSVRFHLEQGLISRLVFNAFGHDLQVHHLTDGNLRPVHRVINQGAGKGAVDLDAIDLDAPQQVE